MSNSAMPWTAARQASLYVTNSWNLLKLMSIVDQLVKNLPAMWDIWIQSLGWEDPLEKGKATHSSIWPGESHGQSNLADCSPGGCKESDAT